MPIYEYQCAGCEAEVEVLLLRADDKPECPDCGSAKLERQFSVTASASFSSSDKQLPMASGEGCGAPRCCGGGGCLPD